MYLRILINTLISMFIKMKNSMSRAKLTVLVELTGWQAACFWKFSATKQGELK